MPVRFGLILAALVASAVPAPAADGWAGEVVLFKHDLDEITAAPTAGGDPAPFCPKFINNRVRKDAGDRVLIRDRGKDWWVKKADVLRLDAAVASASAALAARPNDDAAFHYRAIAHRLKGDLAAALTDCERALRFQPNSTPYRLTRANVHCDRDELDAAIRDYDWGIAFAPQSDVAVTNRGLAWLAKKEYDRAAKDFTEAIRLDARFPDPLVYRAATARLTGRYNAALIDLDAALRIDDQHPDALGGKAWLMATCPDAAYRDGKKAVEAAVRACDATAWKSGEELGTLAVAFAEAGDFARAEKAVRKAQTDRAWAARSAKWVEFLLGSFADKEPVREQSAKNRER